MISGMEVLSSEELLTLMAGREGNIPRPVPCVLRFGKALDDPGVRNSSLVCETSHKLGGVGCTYLASEAMAWAFGEGRPVPKAMAGSGHVRIWEPLSVIVDFQPGLLERASELSDCDTGTSSGGAISRVRIDELSEGISFPSRGGILVFDGDCGFCTRAVRALLRRDRACRVRAFPLQGPHVLELTKITREQALDSVRWLGSDGSVSAGAGAMAAAWQSASGIPLARLYRLPLLGWCADAIYRWVADHRYLLRGVKPYCATAPGECSLGERGTD